MIWIAVLSTRGGNKITPLPLIWNLTLTKEPIGDSKGVSSLKTTRKIILSSDQSLVCNERPERKPNHSLWSNPVSRIPQWGKLPKDPLSTTHLSDSLLAA